MADFKILDDNPRLGTRQYLIDEVSDLAKLPCEEIGSSALVAATSEVYILNNKKEWVKI